MAPVRVVFLGWHALGAVVADLIACAGCGARYQADDEAAKLPACPACGVPDTWESRQGAAFRALAAEIDSCPSLTDLAALGKRLYALALPQDQAGVAWTHYHLRKVALEATVVLGPAARALVARIEAAPARAMPRALQHAASGRGGHAGGMAARVAGLPGPPAARRVGRSAAGAPP